jgi:hypothetical protein
MTRQVPIVIVMLFAALVLAAAPVRSQAPAGQAPAPPRTARTTAPIDLTGYWVSVVTEDWRWRMVTPPKGDYASVPITAEAKRVADAWDPAKDTAAGEQCRSYGAAAIMRVPGRLHITWQDDNTLKVEADAGTQTRLIHFGEWQAPGGEATWQGDSVGEWVIAAGRGGGGRGAGPQAPAAGTPAAPQFGYLQTVTRHLRPGYLRKNGIPYSADTVLTEYWSLFREPNADQWLVVTTVVEDPKYLQTPWVTSPNFKREGNGSKWDPTACSSTW